MSLADLRKPQPKVDRGKWPAWVRIPLWGLDSRVAAWVFVWVSLILGTGCVIGGFFHPLFFAGGLLLLAAIGYYVAIRWVDKHSRWF